MKKILGMVLMLLLWLSSVGMAQTAKPFQQNDLEMSVSMASHYLDAIFEDTMVSLTLIASTPQAKKGEWEALKPYMIQLKKKLPGVYSYILPNGDYYTLERDFTNLNLSNRDYFPSLFAGNPIKGFPIYSRSTGKKSIFIAVPILNNGKTVGALGISVFLDVLNTRLNHDFNLPPHYTWYVLNNEGNTILDKDSDFIFMNPLTKGSESLKKGVQEALKKDNGSIMYDLGGERTAYYQKLSHLDWRMFFATVGDEKIQTPPKLKLTLESFIPDLQNELNSIDTAATKVIEKTKTDFKNENDIRKLLRAILDANTQVIEAAYVNTEGILKYIEPGDYKNFESSDISKQEHIINILKNKKPLLSSSFMAVEHFMASVVVYPVYDNNKMFVGAITVMIRPELFIAQILKKSMIPEDFELWIMQTDGMIVYDEDKTEIGKMLFTDPIYSEYSSLLKLGKEIAATAEGKGSYVYLSPGNQERAIKNVLWKTIRLYDREWKVVLAYRPYE